MPGEINIRIRCPHLACQRILAVPPEARGKLVRCRNCGTMIRIPQASTVAGPQTEKTESAEDAEKAA